MNLHRSSERPEWEGYANNEQNPFQKVAAATKGIVTIGNVLTGAGYLITKSGYNDMDKGRTGKAMAKVFIGRFFDVADGIAADKTKTKSREGAEADAIADQKLMYDGLELMGRHEVAPSPVVRGFGALAILNAYAAVKGKSEGKKMDTSLSGKLSTFIKWGSLVGYMSSKALAESGKLEKSQKAKKASGALALGAFALGAYASYGYVKQAFELSDGETSEVQEPQDVQYAESEGSSYIPDGDQQSKMVPRD